MQISFYKNSATRKQEDVTLAKQISTKNKQSVFIREKLAFVEEVNVITK